MIKLVRKIKEGLRRRKLSKFVRERPRKAGDIFLERRFGKPEWEIAVTYDAQGEYWGCEPRDATEEEINAELKRIEIQMGGTA
jgi:hypothetical protein